MKIPKPTTVDFETFEIKGRPVYPPIPAGVSIKEWGKPAKYYAWGHLTDNNCTWSEAKRALEKAWANKDGVLFHHGGFDVDVAEEHFGLPRLDWKQYHDTLFLLYLDDPHQPELALKPAAERLLGEPPEEQDLVCQWLLANQPVPNIKISKSKQSEFYFMKFLPYAPGGLVGEYANGDTERTERIFKLLYEKTLNRQMGEAYDRERVLMLMLLDIERQGVPVDYARLKQDVEEYTRIHAGVANWILKRLKAPDLNLDSGEQLIKRMVELKEVDENDLARTATGKFKSDKDALTIAVKDKQLKAMLQYRTQLGTCLRTFMAPWLATATASGGLIYTKWNQVRSPDGGTRTGRLSSTPNFQNIPKEFKAIFRHEETDATKAKLLPLLPKGVEFRSLPMVRSYITAFEGEVLIDRDYSQQEPRILAHFDGGDLMDKYVENPWIDFHDYAKAELEIMGKFYDRKPVKNTNLGLIYGMGVGKLAERNEMTVEEAGELKKAILLLYPGLKDMYKDMKVRAKSNQPIRTWGGREYYCEPPKLVDGRIREFDYKMVNVLIQGSAADCTKEAIIKFIRTKKPQWRLLLTVHDEILVSAPRAEIKEAMACLKAAMESVEFDVPMLSEGDYSTTNWEELSTYDKKGKQVYGNA